MPARDLVVLAADKQIQFALRGALNRPQALGIRSITYEFRTHPGRDGGVRTTGASILAGDRSRFAHALMVLDYEGSGSNAAHAVALEDELDEQLRPTWTSGAKAIVIDPEVEVWLWGGEASMGQAVGWSLSTSIRGWLQHRGFVFRGDGKPARPKDAFEALRRAQRRPRSAAVYESIARQISLQKCNDPAFHRLRAQLEAWFGAAARDRASDDTTAPA